MGEVIHIMQCTPRVVKYRRVSQCFNELPVLADSEELFITPVTHISQSKAEEVDCSSLTPPLFFIENKWIGFSYEVVQGIIPEILEVHQEPMFNFKPLYDIGSSGIYTKSEIKTAQNALMFGMERQAVNNIITRKITGQNTAEQGISPLDLFTKSDIASLAKSAIVELWGWFSELGVFFSGFIGIFVTIKIIKFILDRIINGYNLYRSVGCTFKILACVWTTLTALILQNYK